MIVNKYTNGGGGGYVLPTATANRLGGVKVGSGLTVQDDGTLSAEGGGSVPVATTGSTGVVKVGSGLTIDSGGTLSTERKSIIFKINNTGDTEMAALYAELKAQTGSTPIDTTKYAFYIPWGEGDRTSYFELRLNFWDGTRIYFSDLIQNRNSDSAILFYEVALYENGKVSVAKNKKRDFNDYQPKLTAGTGIEITSANTINCTVSGGSGGGDYIVTEALSSITNPTEGMIAYVQSHTGSAQCDVYYIDFAGVTSVDDWLSIYIDDQWGQFMYISIDGEGTVNTLELRDKDSNSKNLATTYKDQWIEVDNDDYTNLPKGYKALYFDGSVLSIAVLGEHEITNVSCGSISGTTGTYSYSVLYEGESFIYTSGNTWVSTEKTIIYVNELDNTDAAALYNALTTSGKSFYDYDIRWYDDADRAFAVQLTAFRSGDGWTGSIWLSGYANHDFYNKFVVAEIQSSGLISMSLQDVPVINSDARMQIDASGNCIDMWDIDNIWNDIAYGESNNFKGLEKYVYYGDSAGNQTKGFIRSVRRDATNEGSGLDIIYISATIDMPDGNSYTGKWHWNHQDTSQGVTKDSWTQI